MFEVKGFGAKRKKNTHSKAAIPGKNSGKDEALVDKAGLSNREMYLSVD